MRRNKAYVNEEKLSLERVNKCTRTAAKEVH